MIIGSGQLATVFKEDNLTNICIFASGVSNSRCEETQEFEREKSLLLTALEENKDKKFAYFSSCALSAPAYPKNAYYQHKQNMEELIKVHSTNYYIFRIPQLFGHLKHHKTLINYLYECIVTEEVFTLYSDAYRYVIDIDDVKNIVLAYLKFSKENIIINIANPYRYKVKHIVEILEKILDKQSYYNVQEKYDGYVISFKELEAFVVKNKVDIVFSKDYLQKKLEYRVNELLQYTPIKAMNDL